MLNRVRSYASELSPANQRETQCVTTRMLLPGTIRQFTVANLLKRPNSFDEHQLYLWQENLQNVENVESISPVEMVHTELLYEIELSWRNRLVFNGNKSVG